MFNVNKQVLKEFLLKAYNEGKYSYDASDLTSTELKEVQAHEEISELADQLMGQLRQYFEWHTRVNLVNRKKYETPEDKEFKKAIVAEFDQTLDQWVKSKLNAKK